MFEYIWIFLYFSCIFMHLYRSRWRGYMLRLTDPEEPPTEEFNPDYTDDLGDDLPGATPHPLP
jgi:hypothetical protein